MRKDAKIGFAVGGVLLAVLTVYAIVVPSKHKTISDKAVSLVTNGKHADVAPAPVTTPTPVPQVEETTKEPTATPGNGAVATDPKPEPVATKGKDGVDWVSLLGKQQINTTTPTGTEPVPTPDQNDKPKDESATTTPPALVNTGVSTENTKTNPPAVADNNKPTNDGVSENPPKTVAANTNILRPNNGDQFYIIKAGQTLTQVAAEEYGNSRFYVAILRANPSINPSKLKPGTKIVLPDISQVKPEATVASAKQPAVKTATGTYTVAAGDTLYRISKKLYGTSKTADEIYEMNKDQIGSNKAHLRLGMVLSLPKTPAATATASSM